MWRLRCVTPIYDCAKTQFGHVPGGKKAWTDTGRGKKMRQGEGEGHREKLGICKRLQSFLTVSSVPADSMSRPGQQQGQSRAISQTYSALLSPPATAFRALWCQDSSKSTLLPRMAGGRIGQWYCNCHSVRGSMPAIDGMWPTQQNY